MGGEDDCAQAQVCRNHGQCTLGDDECVGEAPRSSADRCRREESCFRHGRCSLAPGESECVAEEDDCRGTRICREIGHCTAKGGACVATSPQDCARSEKCVEDGLCILDRDEDECVSDWVNRDTGMVAGGGILIGLGGASFMFGLYAAFVGLFACNLSMGPESPGDRPPGCHPAFPLGFLVGGAALAGGAGVPLLVIGNEDVPPDHAAFIPHLSLGPTAASLEWRF